jgi:hypothetical protein
MRRGVRAAVSAALLTLAACGPGVSPLDASHGAALLTPDGKDIYGITVANGVTTVAAPASNTGGNTRVAFWRASDTASVDQETCATWVAGEGTWYQPGLALRVRTSPERTTAITITNNIVFGARWGFNVHVMDSGTSELFRKIGGFDLTEVFRPGGPSSTAVPPLPWRICGRVVGSTVSFIVWPLTHAQPAWSDVRYGGSVTLPAGWGQAGLPGSYIGHLEPGDVMSFRDLTGRSLEAGAASSGAARTAPADVPTIEPATPPREPTWIADMP